MANCTVFVNNRFCAVHIPKDIRPPDGALNTEIGAKGNERVISPLGQSWNSFFVSCSRVSEDFLPERANQHQPEREAI